MLVTDSNADYALSDINGESLTSHKISDNVYFLFEIADDKINK